MDLKSIVLVAIDFLKVTNQKIFDIRLEEIRQSRRKNYMVTLGYSVNVGYDIDMACYVFERVYVQCIISPEKKVISMKVREQ